MSFLSCRSPWRSISLFMVTSSRSITRTLKSRRSAIFYLDGEAAA